MAKISELADAGAIQATDALPIARGAGNFKYTGLKGAIDGKEDAGTAAAAVTTHEAASDPHPVYLTSAEGNVAYAALTHSHAAIDISDSTAVGRSLVTAADAAAARAAISAAATGHTHALADITDEGALASKNTVATADIDNDAVTYAKIQTVTDARLLGRSAGSAGDAQEITVGSGLALAAGALTATGGGGGFTSINLQSFVGNGTYTPTAGMDYCIVILTGSGGGGGGADSSTTTNDIGVGGGGGAAETRIAFFTAAQIGVSQIVTIGAAGAAGSNAGGNGGLGANSTLGALLTAVGGSGGTGSGTSADSGDSNPGGVGGTGGSGGTLAIDGGDGTSSVAATIDATTGDGTYALAGSGGASFWGGGGKGGNIFSTTIGISSTSAGNAGKAYGSGGGGSACSDTTAGIAGAAGKAGACFVIEFA